jgi:predicted peptidase
MQKLLACCVLLGGMVALSGIDAPYSVAQTKKPAKKDDKVEPGFSTQVFKDADGSEAKYFLFVPHDYKGNKPYPVIVFLHGKGGNAAELEKVTRGSFGGAVRKQEKTFPCIVVFPQSPNQSWQAESVDAQRAMRILTKVAKTYKVDPKRVYLTGLSMGGFGTWSLAAAYPNVWAAIVPICGGGNPNHAGLIAHIPCWCFHGDADPTVKVESSRVMIQTLKAVGGSPKYTEYPGVGHNSWDRAYATKELYDWLLKQKLK